MRVSSLNVDEQHVHVTINIWEKLMSPRPFFSPSVSFAIFRRSLGRGVVTTGVFSESELCEIASRISPGTYGVVNSCKARLNTWWERGKLSETVNAKRIPLLQLRISSGVEMQRWETRCTHWSGWLKSTFEYSF